MIKDVASIAAGLLTKEERQSFNDIDISQLTQLKSESTERNEWERPVSFDEYTLPPFPTTIFPPWLKAYVESVAETTQTPKDMASMAAISILSIAAAKKFEINVYGSWIEPLNTYTLTLMGSANRKSSVFELITRPLLQFEKEECERLKMDIRNRKTEIKTLEKRLEQLININAKNPDEKHAEEIKEINRELEALPELYPPTFIVDDITPESLHKVLKENGEKIGILSAEGGIFEIIRGRYSKELNMDLFLKGHSGDYSRLDRKNGSPMILENPLLTIGIIAQPDVLQDLPKAFHGRGLMARFLYSSPKDFRGYRKIRPTDIPSNIKSEYVKNVKRLLVMDKGGTQRLALTKEADYHFQCLQQNIEERLREDGDLSGYLEWGGKIVGQLARIAGLLHIAKYITTINNIPPQIEKDTILSLLQLKEYFINHAMAAHGCMRTNGEIEDLKYLVSVIERKAKQKYDKKPAEEITLDYRDIQQSAKDRFVKSHLLKNVLKELEQYGYIREEIVGRKSVYKINPHVFKDNIKVSPNPPSKPSDIEPSGSNLGMHEIPSVTNTHNSTPLEPKQETIGENGEKWGQEVDLDKRYNSGLQQQMGEMGDNFKDIIDESSIEDESELI